MSKIALKKEFSRYTKEQIIDVLLDLYDNRPDVKDYFKFFLNPDSEKLFEKYKKAMNKELSRTKHHNSKARISVIKKLLKEFKSFQPDIKWSYNLYSHVISYSLYMEKYYYFSNTLYNGISAIAKDFLQFADDNGELNVAVESIDNIIKPSTEGTRYFKDKITDVLQEYIEQKRL